MSEKKEKIVLDVAYQPQVRTGMDTRRIMINVMLALLPSLAMATWEFGMKPVLMVAVSMLSAVFYEWAYRKLLKKPETIGDCSALLTGMLLAMTLPASSPWWLPLIGNFFAIIVVKQLYGGIGKNFLNPALAGRAFLIASYAVIMTQWTIPSAMAGMNIETVDGITMATPMTYLYAGKPMPEYYSYLNMFLGIMPGCFGEASKVALLVGGIYLICRKIISWRIPVSFIGTVALLTLIFGHEGLRQLRVDDVQPPVRRPVPRRLLHGDRLRHQPRHASRPAPLWRRLRRADRAHPLFRQLPRRRVLRYPYHEPLHLGDRQVVPPSSSSASPRKTSPQRRPLRKRQRRARNYE